MNCLGGNKQHNMKSSDIFYEINNNLARIKTEQKSPSPYQIFCIFFRAGFQAGVQRTMFTMNTVGTLSANTKNHNEKSKM